MGYEQEDTWKSKVASKTVVSLLKMTGNDFLSTLNWNEHIYKNQGYNIEVSTLYKLNYKN